MRTFPAFGKQIQKIQEGKFWRAFAPGALDVKPINEVVACNAGVRADAAAAAVGGYEHFAAGWEVSVKV